MSESENRGPRELIRAAEQHGTLSRRSSAALQDYKILRQIEAALENAYTIKCPGRVLLITMMPDDSQSMTIANKQASVIAGHNELLGALAVSTESKRILLQTRYLNGFVLNPFSPLHSCRPLSPPNYSCTYGTPLFEQTLVTLGTVLAMDEELTGLGATVRSATLLMTDAEATDKLADALRPEVASVVADMRRIGDHIVAGMSFPTRDDSYCRRVFMEIGIEPRYIFSAASRQEVLEAFRLFRQSALGLGSGRSRDER